MDLGGRQHWSLWEKVWVLVGDSMGLGGRQHCSWWETTLVLVRDSTGLGGEKHGSWWETARIWVEGSLSDRLIGLCSFLILSDSFSSLPERFNMKYNQPILVKILELHLELTRDENKGIFFSRSVLRGSSAADPISC